MDVSNGTKAEVSNSGLLHMAHSQQVQDLQMQQQAFIQLSRIAPLS